VWSSRYGRILRGVTDDASADPIPSWRERLGPLGVWCTTDMMTAAAARELAAEVESLGFGALWLPDTIGRDPFAHIAHLMDATASLVFATGIASIHHRGPGPMLQAARTLAEQSDGRFVLGLGVSHQPMVEGIRGLEYRRPLATMRTYLEQMDAAPYMASEPAAQAPRLLAALGPRMLELAASHADGAHPYWTTPEHTEIARRILGPAKLLCVEQKVVLTTDAETARATVTGALGLYADLPNYRNNWLRLGFSDEEIDARSPRFLDAVVAHGEPEQLLERVQQHLDAGADHVCVQPLTPQHPFRVDRAALEQLAPGVSRV
jgi:probable F420-dependent oxidoreductase